MAYRCSTPQLHHQIKGGTKKLVLIDFLYTLAIVIHMQINIYTGRFRMHFGKYFMSPSPNPKCMRNLRVKAIEEFIWGPGEGGAKKKIKLPYFMEKNCLKSSWFINYIPRDCQNKKDSKLFFGSFLLRMIMMSQPLT